MRIKHQQECDPIHLTPGDTLALTYDVYDNGKLISSKELGGTKVGRSLVVNKLAVVDLDDSELVDLSMVDAIAGVFGQATTKKEKE